MLTPTTIATFALDTRRIEDCTWYTPEQRAIFRAAYVERHAAYEAHYEATVAVLEGLSGRILASALRGMARLDTPGCLSGSLEYRETCEVLEAVGLARINALFGHDRAALVERFGGVEGRVA